MVVMTPNNITFLVVFDYSIGKYSVCFFVCIKLRLIRFGFCRAISLRNSKIMKKRPQCVVAISIVVLMENLFINEYRYTPLQFERGGGS